MMESTLGKCGFLFLLCYLSLQANAIDEFEETRKITQNLANLKPRAVSPEILSCISTGKQLAIVKKLPYIGPWIKSKIRSSYKMYDAKLFKIAERCAKLLKIISLSCEGFDCKVDAVSLQSKYQDLMFALVRSSYQLYKVALTSLKELKRLYNITKEQSWDVIEKMSRLTARHQRKIRNMEATLNPIIRDLTQLVDKLHLVSEGNIREADAELVTRTSQMTKIKDELKRLRDTISQLTRDIDGLKNSIPELEAKKDSKEREARVVRREIQKIKECVLSRQMKRAEGPFYWITTHAKEGKYALRASTFPLDYDKDYSADVEEKQGIMDSGNEQYAKMYLEKQRDGSYKIFNKQHKGVLFCSKSRDNYNRPLAKFSDDPEYEDEGRERWQLRVSQNPVFIIYNQRCTNNLCVDSMSGEGTAVVSDCNGSDKNREWRILKDGVDEYEDDSDNEVTTPDSNNEDEPDTGGCTVRTREGDCCYFPHTYRGNYYTSCVPSRNGDWCATTSDYSADRKWGRCVEETPDTPDPTEEPAPKKLKQQELPNGKVKSCGGKRNKDDLLLKISRDIKGLSNKIFSTKDLIRSKNYEIDMKKLEIPQKEAQLRSAERTKARANKIKDRLSTTTKVLPVFSKAINGVRSYVKLWSDTKPLHQEQISTAVTPAPSKRDILIRSGYNLIAYGLAAYDSYKGLRVPKQAATAAYIGDLSAAKKEAFLKKSELLLQESQSLVNNYLTTSSMYQ